MNANHAQQDDRLLQLLADRATEGLDFESGAELTRLLVEYPQFDATHFEAAAAAVDLAMSSPPVEPLPRFLRDRVLMDAGRAFTQLDFDQPDETTPMRLAPPKRASAAPLRLLAAACIALAVFGGWWLVGDRTPRSLAVGDQYQRFLRDADDVQHVSWVGKEQGFERVSGEVIWSDTRQSGFMRLVGLPQNDPRVAQYQLWIVDPERDKHPVDGGVFDVTDAGEIIVAIDAKLEVAHPTVFAITLEQPGGVVVSDGPLIVVGTSAS
ncbi:MAG: anti-sigma factor [Phycisphaerales bacterium]|nr:anti-sigma factor [Phycisphaerales bacterium]